MAHDHFVGRSLDLYGEFSEHEIRVMTHFVADGAVIVEAGANIGALTVPLARAAGSAGQVIAYEPQAPLVALLRHNLAANGLGQVEVRQTALGRVCGTVCIPPIDYHRTGNFGAVSMKRDAAPDATRVAQETIDDLRLARLDLLKIDVEGMEIEVLAGAVETIRRLAPTLYVENDRDENSRSLIELIESLGYRAWWHLPPLYNPDNFFGNAENAFPRILSVNLLCVPPNSPHRIVNATAVEGPDDTWRAAAKRLRGEA
ncbi:MAG: FkbM family methyltransferase [Alphaproteobacteria bacterium]|nr:FkbM family methyltransferase [Alphaproteobacteria bacterium]